MEFSKLWNFYINKLQGHPSACKTSYGKEELSAKIGDIFTNKDSTILTIGSGEGLESELFLELGYKESVGLTLDSPQYKSSIVGDMHNLSEFIPETIDYVYENHAFEHTFAPFIHCLEVWTVMKPGGKWYIQYPTPLIMGGTHPDPMINSVSHHHPTMLIKEQAHQLFRATGFIILNYKSDGNQTYVLRKIPKEQLADMGVHSEVITTLRARRKLWKQQ